MLAIRFIVGLLAAYGAYRIMRSLGRQMLLLALDDPIHCGRVFIDPNLKGMFWLIFGILPLALTGLAFWLMPHWILSVGVVVLILAGSPIGHARQRNAEIEKMARFVQDHEGLDPGAAQEKATKTVDMLIDASRMKAS